MIRYIRSKLDGALETIRAFFQESNPAGSSKRLTFIMSFLNGIAICWFSLITGAPIDSTVLSLSVTLITISSGSYLIGKKGVAKPDVIEKKSDIIKQDKVSKDG